MKYVNTKTKERRKIKLYFALGVMWGEVVFMSGILWEESVPMPIDAEKRSHDESNLVRTFSLKLYHRSFT
jgi:hypothetical protein